MTSPHTGAASRALLVAALLVATGCDVTFPWSSSDPRKVNLSVTPSSLRFEGTLCDPTPEGQLIFITGDRPDAVVRAELDPGAFWAFPAGPFEIMVTPMDPAVVGTGEHTATLRLFPVTPGGQIPGDRVVEVPLAWAVSPCPLTLQADPMTLEVIAGVTAPVTRTVTAVESDRTAPWSAELLSDGACVGLDLMLSPVSGDALSATLTLSAAPNPWSYAVGDSVCAPTIRLREGGREASLPIPIHAVRQTLTFDPPVAVFTTYQGQRPTAQVVTVTPDHAPLSYEPFSDYAPSYSVQTTGAAPGTFSICPVFPYPYVGTREGWTYFRWAGGTASFLAREVVLPRSLTASTPSQVVFTVGATTTLADLTTSVALTSSAGPIPWRASVDVPWARLSSVAGVTDVVPGFDVTLDVAFLATGLVNLPLGKLTVEYPEPDGTPNRIDLSLYGFVNLTALTGGAPRAVGANAASSLTVAGSISWSSTFSLDGGAPVAASWSNYALAAVPLPPLAPGRHVLSVTNALGLDRGSVSFDAVALATRAPAAVASPGHRTQLSFDDARGILYAANPGAGVVERYLEASGWARETLEVPGLRDAALSPSGGTLAAVASDTIRVVDTETFALAPAQPVNALPGADATLDWRLAFTADGQALVVPVTQDLRPFGFFDGVEVRDAYYSGCGGRPFASVDGRTVGVACRATGSPYAIELYTPGTTFYSTPGAGFASLGGPVLPQSFDPGLVTFDPAQSRFLALDLSVPGATDTVLVDLKTYTARPGRLPGTTATAVVTRDGSRAVTLDGATGNVRVFDLATLPLGATDPLAELGPAGGVAPAASPGAAPVMALSADDRTLFLAGDDGVVIVPLP